jgi:SAM-dependent methyltransferase
MTDTERLREHVHGMWAGVAPAWEERADFVDRRAAGLTARLLERAELRPGDRVLELACGLGGTGLAAAELAGEVVLSDVAPSMVAAAVQRAAARGLRNVGGRGLDLERIDEPGDAFDVVLCREGLMFANDPARAGEEIRRVLRPGGRAVIAVWGPPKRNPWLGLVFHVVAEELGQGPVPAGLPGPFALSDATRLQSLLPFEDLIVETHEVALHASGFDEWWERTIELSGPLARMLAAVPDDARRRIEARLRGRVAQWETKDGLTLPGESLIAFGTK